MFYHDEQLSSYGDILPKGAIPVCGMRILSYINSDGVLCYQFAQAGDTNVANVIGVIEMVKADILRAALEAGRRKSEEEDY